MKYKEAKKLQKMDTVEFRRGEELILGTIVGGPVEMEVMFLPPKLVFAVISDKALSLIDHSEVLRKFDKDDVSIPCLEGEPS